MVSPERKLENTGIPTLTSSNFMNNAQNIINFQQKYPEKETYNTIYRIEYKNPKEQTRNSVLVPFVTKKGAFEKNKDELEKYREK